MFDRIDLPIRDLLRVLVPGLLASYFLDWAFKMFYGSSLYNTGLIDGLVPALFIGLLGYSASFHKWLPPWSRMWRSQTERIRKTIRVITGLNQEVEELHGKPIYKIWIDAICHEPVRAHLHYTTGLFYMFTTLTMFSALALISLISTSMYLRLATHPTAFYFKAHPEFFVTCAFVVLSLVSFGLGSRRLLKEVIEDGLAAMHLRDSAEKLTELSVAVVRFAADPIPLDELRRRVNEAACAVRPTEGKRIESVSGPEIVDQFDLRANVVRRVCHLAIRAKNDADAIILNGRPNLFNGEIQARIQTLLESSLAPRLGVERIRLQVTGSTPLEAIAWPAPVKKPIERVTFDEAVREGVVSPDGLVAGLCQKYQIAEVLLRNGKVLGPCPSVETAVRLMVPKLTERPVVFDPFAGTQIVRNVIEKLRPGSQYVGRDQLIDAHYDAFSDPDTRKCEMIVVDPLYEDVLNWIVNVLPKIEWKHLIIKSGDIADVDWNRAARRTIERIPNLIRHMELESESSRHGGSIGLYSRQT